MRSPAAVWLLAGTCLAGWMSARPACAADADLDTRLLDAEELLERAMSEADFARISVRLEDAQDHALEAREAAERAAVIVRELRERYGRSRPADQSTGIF